MFIWDWQIMILKGKAIKNPDGSSDNWYEQKTHYGIAFADAFLACPVSIAGIILVLIGSRWEYYLLALVSFWLVWANVMTKYESNLGSDSHNYDFGLVGGGMYL